MSTSLQFLGSMNYRSPVDAAVVNVDNAKIVALQPPVPVPCQQQRLVSQAPEPPPPWPHPMGTFPAVLVVAAPVS